jgi:hypothetical protein
VGSRSQFKSAAFTQCTALPRDQAKQPLFKFYGAGSRRAQRPILIVNYYFKKIVFCTKIAPGMNHPVFHFSLISSDDEAAHSTELGAGSSKDLIRPPPNLNLSQNHPKMNCQRKSQWLQAASHTMGASTSFCQG